MKLLLRILFVLFVILILFFSSTCIFLKTKGKVLLTQKLEEVFKKDVSIGDLGLKIPFSLEVKNLKVAKLADVNCIYLSPSFFGLLSGKVVLNQVKILKPEINWDIVPATDTAVEPNTSRDSLNSPINTGSTGIRNKGLGQFIIKDLRVMDGVINLTDRNVNESGLRITLKEVAIDLDNLYLYPESGVTDFRLTAKVPWDKDSIEGNVYGSGWINLYKKEMRAKFEIESIDAVYLYPYYSNWVDLENSLIRQARLNFLSDIIGENNDIIANCRLELTDIQFWPRPADKPEHKAEKITTAVLGIFRSLNQGRVVLNFTIRTKMDSPKFSFTSINEAVDKTLIEAVKSGRVKRDDVALLPARIFENIAKGTSGATRAIIDGAVSMGKGIKDAFLDALKKEESSGEAEAGQEVIFKN